MNTRCIRSVAVMACIVLMNSAWPQVPATPSDEMKQNVAATLEAQADVNSTVQRALDEVMTRVASPEWLAEQAHLKREIQVLTGVASDNGADDRPPMAQDRIVVFVSSSMPLATLRNYAKDLERVNGLMVLRGMVGGMRTMGPTLSFISRVLRVDPECEGGSCAMRRTNVVIDPILFRRNGVSGVPAAVFVEAMPLQPYCERFDAESIPDAARHIVYGDVSLKQMASDLYRLSNNQRLAKLRKAL